MHWGSLAMVRPTCTSTLCAPRMRQSCTWISSSVAFDSAASVWKSCGQTLTQCFKSVDWRETLQQYDAQPSYANPYTPTENGLQERTWGIIMPAAQALMKTTEAPRKFWSYAAAHACHIHNRIYHRGVDGVPFTMVTWQKTNIQHWRT